MNVDEMLRDRDARYGNYATQAACAQRLKSLVHEAPRWFDLGMAQREALDHILTKISRIVHGDPTYIDSWNDVIGYSKLVVVELEKNVRP